MSGKSAQRTKSAEKNKIFIQLELELNNLVPILDIRSPRMWPWLNQLERFVSQTNYRWYEIPYKGGEKQWICVGITEKYLRWWEISPRMYNISTCPASVKYFNQPFQCPEESLMILEFHQFLNCIISGDVLQARRLIAQWYQFTFRTISLDWSWGGWLYAYTARGLFNDSGWPHGMH